MFYGGNKGGDTLDIFLVSVCMISEKHIMLL